MEIYVVSSVKGTKKAQRGCAKEIVTRMMLFTLFVKIVKVERTRILRSRPDLHACVLI